MSSPWRKVANISSKLKNLTTRICPPELLQSHINQPTKSNDVPPLNFPELPNRLPHLLDLGASEDHARLLYAKFITAAQNFDAALSQHYYDDAPKLWDGSLFAVGSRSMYIQAIQSHIILLRTQAVERLWNALFSCAQILFSQACPTLNNPGASITVPSVIPAPSSKRKRQGRPSAFTAEQTFALNALFACDDQYSPEDKEFIAQTLNLNRDQVNRWFCNARARKKSGSRLPRRCGSLDSVRTVSSDRTSTESQKTDQFATTSEVASSTNSTLGLNNTSPGLTISTPGCSTPDSELTNSTPGLSNASAGFAGPNPQVDSLDVYLDYSAYLEPGDLTDNLLTQHEQASSTRTIPVLSPSSSVEPQVAVTTAPFGASLFPQPQDWSCGVPSFNEPSHSLDLNTFLPLPSLPESHISNASLYGLDLSKW